MLLASLNYVLSHHTKLSADVMISRGKILISTKKKRGTERMERVLCFNAEFSLPFFSLAPPIQLGVVQEDKKFF